MEFRSLRSRHPMKPIISAQALRFFNLCLALLLLYRSSCLRTLLLHSFSLFNHSFYVFLLQNLIIFFIFALSHSNHFPRLHATAAPYPPTQTFCSRLVHSPVPALAQTPKATSSLTTMTRNKAPSSIDCYRRVRSGNVSGRILVAGSAELNGVNAVARYGGELGRRLCSVDTLSKDDFNRTVEEYIAKHRSMLQQEHGE